MNVSTLGGLIKDYRMQKGISQLDIAFALGWKEPSRLSRIEQGRTEKPTRDVLDKIINQIGLNNEEKNTLLLIGGYLPTDEEIQYAQKITHATIHDWPYPAGMMDFSWRLITGNKHIANIFNIPGNVHLDMYKSNLRVLDLLFGQMPDAANQTSMPDESQLLLLKTIIAEFKYEHRHRTKEKWYIDHVKKLIDNELFRSLWIEVQAKPDRGVILAKYTKKHFVHPGDTSKMLNFYIFIVPVLEDPRFEVELHVPIDIETYAYYNKK